MNNPRLLQLSILLGGVLVLLGCGESSRDYVEPTQVEVSNEFKSYLTGFIASSRKSKKLTVSEIEPVLESMEGYRESLGEKIEPAVEIVRKLKTAAEANSTPKQIGQILNELDSAVQTI